MITIEHEKEDLKITVYKGMFGGGLMVDQGNDLIYVNPNSIKMFVAAVRAVASEMLGEEV